MKNSFLLSLLTVIMFCFSNCRKTNESADKQVLTDTINGDLLLYTQRSIDSFAAVKSRFQNIIINGRVVIGRSNTDINNLSQLYKIKSISGSLGINQTKSLLSLNGLQNITSVEDLFLMYNELLTDLRGLDSLKTVRGYLFIEVNNRLASLDGLGNLEFVGASLKFNNGFSGGLIPTNPELKTIYLPNLKKVGGEINLTNIFAASTIDFPRLDSVLGNLVIADANRLNHFSGFKALNYVGGDLSIVNASVNTLTGFNNLKTIGKVLRINQNPNITELSGFNNLVETGLYIEIVGNNSLRTLNGLQAMRKASLIDIQYNRNLIDFCAIKALIQNILRLYPATSPYQLFELYNNSTALPASFSYTYVLNNCP